MSDNTPNLFDRHGRTLHDLRVSVTDRCNFRCGYCMPKDVFGRDHQFLKRSELLSFEEIESLVRLFIRFGVRKVRLTGGEPLLRKDLEVLIEKLAGLDKLSDLALTTNASLLTRDRVRSLRSAGIDRVNISLDALNREVYNRINQIDTPMEEVLAGIENAMSAGFDSVKINMVVQKGVNDQEIIPMVRRFRGSGAILRFIEFMDVGNHNQWTPDQVFSSGEIVALIDASFPLEPVDANYSGEVAKRWRYQDGQGEIGVISSISQPFCGGCARARLSAVGEMYSCLFATRGVNLREALQNGGEQAAASLIASTWKGRADRYSEERLSRRDGSGNATTSFKVEMSYIGG